MTKRLLGIGALLGVVAVVLLKLYVSNIEASQKGARFLRLSTDVSLNRGDTIALEMLETEELPERFASLSRMALPDSEDTRLWIDGKAVTHDIPGGELLLFEYFHDKDNGALPGLSNGKRAIAIPVDAVTSVSYFVEPDSRVDILGTFDHPRAMRSLGFDGVASSEVVTTGTAIGAGERETRTILQNIRVLAVGQAISPGRYAELMEGGYSTVTVEVTAEQAEVLTFSLAEVQGTLTLVLRHPADDDVAPTRRVSWDALR